jgi:hypothetical protein
VSVLQVGPRLWYVKEDESGARTKEQNLAGWGPWAPAPALSLVVSEPSCSWSGVSAQHCTLAPLGHFLVVPFVWGRMVPGPESFSVSPSYLLCQKSPTGLRAPGLLPHLLEYSRPRHPMWTLSV